ncbi:UNVERIFIED_CONTAM: hypothetical protein GTU68_008640 [Idotea baltica]|nr:hypothetical protein [Idotea baltica]
MSDSSILATVKRVYGSSVVLQLNDGSEQSAETSRRNKSLVCGDRVVVENRAESYFVVDNETRRSEFFRTDGFGRRKVIAANVDQILLVIAPLPEPHMRTIDRYWVATRNCGIPLKIVLNKSDLTQPKPIQDIVQLYTSLKLDVLQCSAKEGGGIAKLRESLRDNCSVFVGPSGVGKSSLVNSLCGEASASTAGLSEQRDEGRHTTTTTDFYDIGDNARILDAPGIREFGLDHYDQQSLELGFVEISERAAECRFRDCTHQETPGCAVEAAVKAGSIDTRRMESYLQLLTHIS